MLLPGPEAMQLATYAGWRLHGLVGGLVADLLFVLPGALIIIGLGTVYAYYGNVALVNFLVPYSGSVVRVGAIVAGLNR